ncbi:MAG TPA: condensation domain-containing protein, partial [Ktedonobacteraceae bacterium]|nr:condensation domain-containing protein [Ktedonobacteraceae bacterium]
EFFEDVDLSRTVGWFTSLFPVVLEKAEEGSVLESLKRVKTILRELPQRGSGYGLLRYLADDPVVQQAIQALPQAELSFNYLGQTDQVFARSRFFAPAEEEIGAGRAASNLRETLLEVTAIVNAGKLQVLWTYSKHIHSPATIEALAGRYIRVLQELLAMAALPHVPTVTDFPLVELEPATFEQLLKEQGQIEDIYPLAPAQNEMLRASLASPGSWAYFNQFSCQFHGTVNVAALQRACQRVVDRHTVLRTSFVWKGLPRALQVVRRQSVLPFDFHDWQSLSPEEQQSRWIAYKNADRARGFDLETAPLVRLTLIRVTHDVSYFIWSHHHLLMDGWCMSPLLQEVFNTYRSFCQGQGSQMEPASPYREYIAWLQRQDSTRAEQFWRQTLQGLDRPTLLASSSPAQISPADQFYEERDVQLPAQVTKNLHAFTRRYHLTANTVFQGAWALTLSQFTGQSDLIFGATIADRPADLRDVEARIGLFINTLPVRLQVPSSSRLLFWLQQIQEQQAILRQYVHSSLTDIHTWCSWTPGQPLFQCFLRFQNYPKDLTLEQQPGDFAIEAVSSIDRWHYPLSLVVNLAQECRLEISYQRDFFPDSLIGQILAQLQQLLTLIVESPEEHIADLLARCPRP